MRLLQKSQHCMSVSFRVTHIVRACMPTWLTKSSDLASKEILERLASLENLVKSSVNVESTHLPQPRRNPSLGHAQTEVRSIINSGHANATEIEYQNLVNTHNLTSWRAVMATPLVRQYLHSKSVSMPNVDDDDHAEAAIQENPQLDPVHMTH